MYLILPDHIETWVSAFLQSFSVLNAQYICAFKSSGAARCCCLGVVATGFSEQVHRTSSRPDQNQTRPDDVAHCHNQEYTISDYTYYILGYLLVYNII